MIQPVEHRTPIQIRRPRWWIVAAAVVVALAVLAFRVVVDRLHRDVPNYSLVENGFYLGGHVPQPPPGTNAVLNLCELEDPYRTEVYRWEPIRNAGPAPTLDWLRQQVAFVESQRTAGHVVYVHCRNGVSRSGMVVVACYMARNHWTRDQAVAFVQSHRPELRPNPVFMDLLSEWERSLKDGKK